MVRATQLKITILSTLPRKFSTFEFESYDGVAPAGISVRWRQGKGDGVSNAVDGGRWGKVVCGLCREELCLTGRSVLVSLNVDGCVCVGKGVYL